MKTENLPISGLHVTTECVDDGVCYRFTLTDRGSDGICCDDGEGYYQISVGGKSPYKFFKVLKFPPWFGSFFFKI